MSMPNFDNLFDLPLLAEDEIEKLRAHVDEMAAVRGLTWEECEMHWGLSDADLEARSFRSPVIRRELDYLSGLHEIGHLELELPTDDEDPYPNELKVWEWTLREARIVPSEGARGEIRNLVRGREGSPSPTAEQIDCLEKIAYRGEPEKMQWRGSEDDQEDPVS